MTKYKAVGIYLDDFVLLDLNTNLYVVPTLSLSMQFKTLPEMREAVCNNFAKMTLANLTELIDVPYEDAIRLMDECWEVPLDAPLMEGGYSGVVC